MTITLDSLTRDPDADISLDDDNANLNGWCWWNGYWRSLDQTDSIVYAIDVDGNTVPTENITLPADISYSGLTKNATDLMVLIGGGTNLGVLPIAPGTTTVDNFDDLESITVPSTPGNITTTAGSIAYDVDNDQYWIAWNGATGNGAWLQPYNSSFVEQTGGIRAPSTARRITGMSWYANHLLCAGLDELRFRIFNLADNNANVDIATAELPGDIRGLGVKDDTVFVASRADGAEAWTINFTETAAVPDAPTGLTGTTTSSTVSLTWDDPDDDTITGYEISRKTGSGSYSVIVSDTGSDAQSYADTTVAAGTTYTYKIQAINDTGDSADSNEFEITTYPANLTLTGIVANTANNFELAAANTDPEGLCFHQNYWRSVDTDNNVIYSYLASDPTVILPTIALHADNTNPFGITSDGTYMYVADLFSKVFVYDANGYVRQFNITLAFGYAPRGITCDVDNNRLWVSAHNFTQSRFYAFTIPESGVTTVAPISNLTFDGLVSSFSLNGMTFFEGYLVTITSNGIFHVYNTADNSLVSGIDLDAGLLFYGLGRNGDSVYASPSGSDTVLAFTLVYTSAALDTTAPTFEVDDNDADYATTVVFGGTYTVGVISDISETGTTSVIDGDDDVDTSTAGEYTVTYTVTDEAGNSTEIVETVTVSAEILTVPDAPTGLSTSEVSTGVELSWTDPSDSTITDYAIFRQTGTGAYSELTTTDLITGTSYIDTTVEESTDYTYKIQAVNDTGNSGDSSEVTITTADTTAPTIESGVPASADVTTVEVSWRVTFSEDVQNVDRTDFGIKRVVAANFDPHTVTQISASVYDVFGTLPTPDVYHLRLRGTSDITDLSGNLRSGTGEISDSTITYTAAATVPEDPTGLAGSEVSGEVALTWDDPTDDTITGYKIFRKTDTAAYTTLVEDTASTTQSYTDDTVSEGTTYTYKIQAVNDTGNSGDSNEFEIRTINHHTVSLSDSLSITDAVTRTSNITRSMTDSLAITDTITKLRSVPRALIDSLSITDTISKIRAVTVRLTEGSATTTTTEDTLGIRALVGSAVSSTVLLGMAYHDAANTLYQTSRESSISTLHSRSYDGTTLATALTEQEETAVGVAYTALAVSANKLLVAQRIPTAAVHDYDISLTDGALTNKRTLTVAAAADALPIKMQGMSVHISSGKLAIADVETNTIIDYDYDAVAGTLSGKRPLTVSDSVFTPTNPRSISFHGNKLVVVDRTIDKIYSYNYDTDAGTISGETELADETDIQSSVFVGDDLLFGDATFVINKRLFTPGVTTTTGAALRISDALTTSSGAIVSLTDSISITDTITRLKAATRSLTDSISLSDSVTRSKLSNTILTLADSLSISDAITRIRATTVHLTEDSATSTTSQAITVNADKSPDLDITDASIGDVSEAVYDSPSFDVSNEDTFPSDVIFSPDGLKMFVLGASSDSIYQYTLSTAWDINTAVYDTVLLNVSSQEGAPYGFTFSPDGTKMFIVGALSDSVHSYSLATAWDISDVTYISAFNVGSEDGSPHGVTFSPDGLKMFIVGAGSDSVYQYTLSTAWDISTAVHHSISFSVNSEDTFPSGVTFSTDGLKMFIMGNSTDSVYQYSLTTAWDISDVTYNSVSLDITSQDTFPHGVTFSSDGTKMFVIGSSSDSVHAYNIPLSAGITSDDIIISDDYRTSTDGVSITIDTTHTDRTSLSFRVRNPAGDWTDSINLADSASQSFDLTFPNEGDTDGTWHIEITDGTPGIVGTLDSWDLDITTTSVTETTTSGSLFISDSITRTKSSGAMVSLSDSLSISDGITRLKAATRTLSDSLSISDGITRLKAATRSLTDSLSATDTITKLRHVHSSLTDSLSITDSIAKLKSKTNTLTDSLSITDSVTRLKAAKRSFTESLTITDTIYASTAGAIRLVDSLSITDSMTMIKAATRSLSDSLSISDTVSEIRTEIRSLTDSLSISDTISKIRAVTVSLTEGATTTTVTPATPDSLGDAVSLGSSLESVVSRGMAYHNTPGMMYYVSHESGTSTIASRLYNTITTLIGAALSTQDTLSSMTITALAVSGNKLLAAQRSPTNQMYDYDISTTDGAISNIRTITPSDIPGTVHGMSVHQTSGKVAISDVATAGIYDYDYNSATGVMDAQRLLVISDGVFTPTAARSISFHGDKLIISDFGTDKMYSYNYDSVAGTLSGETELADETNVQASTFAGDDLLLIRDDRIIYRRPFTVGTPSSTSTVVSGAALSISDALTKSSGAIVLLSDSLSITDSLTRLKAATRALTDSVTISDVLHGGTAGVVRLSDSLAITDAVTRMKTTTRSLSDSLSITDTVRNIRVEIRRLADSLSITDSAVIIQTKLVQLTDSLSITDAATRMQTRVIRLADSLSITDGIIKSQTFVRSLSDSLSISDSLHVPQDYIRHLTDSLSITDSAAAFKRNITRSRIYRATLNRVFRAKLG